MDLDIIYYIRDEMLRDPDIDASFIWSAARLAEEDKLAYEMFNNWMRETNPHLKTFNLNVIKDRLEELNLY